MVFICRIQYKSVSLHHNNRKLMTMKSASNMHDVLAFLRQLSINNDRTWFKAHKGRCVVLCVALS